MTKWLLSAALILMAFPSRGIAETQPSASTQVEEIYIVRSVRESRVAPTDFCAQAKTGFHSDFEDQYTFRSTATRPFDGRMLDTNVKMVGSAHGCTGRTADPAIYRFYLEMLLGRTALTWIGDCTQTKSDFPEKGIGVVHCVFNLSDPLGRYVGGQLTTNTLHSLKDVGLDTDPPGYTQPSIATIRLWRRRGAPSSATTQSNESLVGTWKLVSLTNMGFLTYTADGRFSVLIANNERKPISHAPPHSIEEKAQQFDGFYAYAGSYTFSGDQVVHHIEVAWEQVLVNTDQVRSVKLDGDRLTLRGGFLVDGVMYAANTELVWERMKPNTTDTKK